MLTWLLDPERHAETLLRRAGRSYHPDFRPRGDWLIRQLEGAVALAQGPRTLLALGMARYARSQALGTVERLADILAGRAAAGRSLVEPAAGPSDAAWPLVASLVCLPEGAGEPELAEVLARQPDNWAAHLYLGAIAARHDEREAEAHFGAAAETDPENALPLYLVASMRVRADDTAGVLRCLEQGNARLHCRVPKSPALEAVGGARFTCEEDPLSEDAGALLLQLVWSLVGPCPWGAASPSAPSHAWRLLDKGQASEAIRLCEAVWQMGRRFAGVEPLQFMTSYHGAEYIGRAIDALTCIYRRLGDLDAVVQSREHSETLQDANDRRIGAAQPGRPMRTFWRNLAWQWALPGGLGIAGGAAGLLAFGLRAHAAPLAISIGALAAAAFVAAIVLRREAHTLPTRWFRDEEREVVERYLALLPDGSTATQAA